eukprot:m.254393 g.254393  ORF g.254393 m.254393 type:complete len:126 (-) comp15493_c5_seq46:1726-2103(-)
MSMLLHKCCSATPCVLQHALHPLQETCFNTNTTRKQNKTSLHQKHVQTEITPRLHKYPSGHDGVCLEEHQIHDQVIVTNLDARVLCTSCKHSCTMYHANTIYVPTHNLQNEKIYLTVGFVVDPAT